MPKSFFASKTIWLNLATLVASLTAVVAGSDLIQDYPQAIAIAAAFQGALNIVLRIFTKAPIR